jgi:hypothetical protein
MHVLYYLLQEAQFNGHAEHNPWTFTTKPSLQSVQLLYELQDWQLGQHITHALIVG